MRAEQHWVASSYGAGFILGGELDYGMHLVLALA